ncbi:MAG: energy transducer TonB [Paludibacteraceae bacterium]|nr:energy transducer TonB [Paludibacteraceae bacterium]MBQ9101315.1 energy transducer TonB [Paludibacteraceae bacterium]
MEIKKSPKADLENKRSMFILIGFVLAFGFTYICFEWTNTEVTVHEVEDTFINQSEDLIIPQTTQIETPPEKIEKPKEVVQQVLKVVSDEVETTATVEIQEQSTEEAIEFTPMDVQEEEEAEEEIFQVVEKMASFPGGNAKLMEFLRKELVYPQIAIDNNVQGRVFVQFVVNRDGSIQDVKVTRGVDPILDEEAIRVVKKMPKWVPAEQRGKTVRSRFTLPVMFKFK